MITFHSTTIVAAKRGNSVAIAGDGQVTLGEKTIMKQRAKKVRRLYQGQVLAGFAGAAADAFTLFDKFEAKLEQYHGNITRAAVELAKEWRTDRTLRQLEALLVVLDLDHLFVISGTGEIIEPDDDFVGIGSGGSYAQAACQALFLHTDLSAAEIVKEAIRIAASICVFTNENITVEELVGGV